MPAPEIVGCDAVVTGVEHGAAACYEYVYGEDALILDDRVIFVDSRTACDLGL
jgi:hypothetical protein